MDDNPDILGMLFDVLDAKDYQTRIAKDANRVGEIIKAEMPDKNNTILKQLYGFFKD